MRCAILILLIFFSCTSTSEHSDAGADNHAKNEADRLYTLITQKIDSAILLYDTSIIIMKNNGSVIDVKNKFEPKIAKLNHEISDALNEMTNYFISHKKSQEEYESYIKKINLNEVGKKHEELSNLGVVIELKKRHAE